MSNLVIAEHDNRALKAATLHTLGAAQQLPGDIHVLVAGSTVFSSSNPAEVIRRLKEPV